MGGDRAPSDLEFVKLRGRKIEGAEREGRSGRVPTAIYIKLSTRD